MAVKIIEVPELGAVHLYKRRGIRSIRLSINHDGSVRVSLPSWLPDRAGADFALKQKDWILEKRVVTLPLKHGGRIGKAHHLLFIHEAERKNITTRLTNAGEIRVYLPKNIDAQDAAAQAAAHRAAVRALRAQAQKLLPGRLRFLAQQHGFSYKSVSIKQFKSRWGSCSSQKEIALSCYLMQLPWHLIDYVLLHELTHTRIMAHGQPFWNEMQKHLPNLKAIRREIRTHHPVLITS